MLSSARVCRPEQPNVGSVGMDEPIIRRHDADRILNRVVDSLPVAIDLLCLGEQMLIAGNHRLDCMLLLSTRGFLRAIRLCVVERVHAAARNLSQSLAIFNIQPGSVVRVVCSWSPAERVFTPVRSTGLGVYVCT